MVPNHGSGSVVPNHGSRLDRSEPWLRFRPDFNVSSVVGATLRATRTDYLPRTPDAIEHPSGLRPRSRTDLNDPGQSLGHLRIRCSPPF
jgi:hypothetical protein